jgi:hypothetical protein
MNSEPVSISMFDVMLSANRIMTWPRATRTRSLIGLDPILCSMVFKKLPLRLASAW